jgi:hypothetical protein
MHYSGQGAILDIAVPSHLSNDPHFKDTLFKGVGYYCPELFYLGTEKQYVPHHFSVSGDPRRTISFGTKEQRFSHDYWEFHEKRKRRRGKKK